MATSEVRACFVCEDEEVGNEATLIVCTCGRHHICIECLRHGVRAVLADESCHPLRCADNSCPPVSSELLLHHLAATTDPKDANLRERLEFKLEEYNTPRAERVYCNNPSCIRKHGVSLFLNPRLYASGDRITCPDCNIAICRLCRLSLDKPVRAHVCPTSPLDDNISAFLNSIPKEDRWLTRQCQECGAWITKESACNHMSCRCGGEFCLCCGLLWQPFWTDCRNGCPKYEAPVYDADGYNQNGYHPDTGLDRNGVHWTTNNPDIAGPQFDEDGFDGDGWDREGYDRDGFDDWGFNREGRDREGYDAMGFDIHLFDRTGHDKAGVPRSSYPDHDENGGLSFNIFGYDQEGYNRQGRDINGFDREGYDTEGYDYHGFDQSGFNRNGLNFDGFSRHHRDPNGNIEPGFRLATDGNVQRDHICTGWGCCAQLQALSPNDNGCAACRLMFREGQRPDYVHWGDVPICAACAMEGFGYLSSLSVWERAGFLGLAEMIGRLELGEDFEIDETQIERRADHGW